MAGTHGGRVLVFVDVLREAHSDHGRLRALLCRRRVQVLENNTLKVSIVDYDIVVTLGLRNKCFANFDLG